MMSFAVLCQTKGLGSSFQCAAHTWMASVSAATESKAAVAEPSVGSLRGILGRHGSTVE